MYKNKESIEMFNQMVAMGAYYDSGRPVVVEPQMIVDDICSKLPMTKNDIVLDVGCGTGVVTIPLAQRCKFVHALDAAEKVITEAKDRCRQEHVINVEYHLGSALKLPFKTNTFDHVLMYAVIHYFENKEQVSLCVAEMIRVCKPAGHILIAEIPDQRVRQTFEQKAKTPEEKEILERFQANRGEYDRLFKKFVKRLPQDNHLVLDCEHIAKEAIKLGCKGKVCRQDIQQPFSLTRRDVLLIKS